MAWEPAKLSLLDVTSNIGNAEPGSIQHTMMLAEFTRRQTIAQVQATKYMLWSVIAIAVTSGINALFAFLIWYAPNLPH